MTKESGGFSTPLFKPSANPQRPNRNRPAMLSTSGAMTECMQDAPAGMGIHQPPVLRQAARAFLFPTADISGFVANISRRGGL
jgi:hypothetical protein